MHFFVNYIYVKYILDTCSLIIDEMYICINLFRCVGVKMYIQTYVICCFLIYMYELTC